MKSEEVKNTLAETWRPITFLEEPSVVGGMSKELVGDG